MIRCKGDITQPFLKSKNFMPFPVAKYGVPKYADSSIIGNNVWGTAAWQSWWEEQFYYCIHGYETGGVWIPGRFYYFLNFNHLTTIHRGKHLPDYMDFQLEEFYIVEQAKQEKLHIVEPKARRLGLSEVKASIINHGCRFIESYQAGISTSQIGYMNDFIKKFDDADSLLPSEMYMRKKIGGDNKDNYIYGWKDKDQFGNWQDQGSQSILYKRVMAENPNLFKGTMMNDCILDEVGEMNLVDKVIGASKDAMTVGEESYGTIYLIGTGNKSGKGTKHMQEIYDNADAHGFIRNFIPRTKMYFPYVSGSKNPVTGALNEVIPNLIQYESWQRVGIADEEAAYDAIQRELEILKKKPDKTMYLEKLQNNATKIEHVWLRMGSNNFPADLLNEQGFRISSEPQRYKHYHPEYMCDDQMKLLYPLKVKMVPYTDVELANYAGRENELESVMLLNTGHHMQGWRGLNMAGLDSYDIDQSKTSKSLGSMVVLRQFHKIPSIEQMVPIALIRCRPVKKEAFYELCLKLAIYFDLTGNPSGYGDVLVDVDKGAVIQYFKDNLGKQFLAIRPTKFESEKSEQGHEFGIKLTTYSKPLMISTLQTYFGAHTEKIWFPHIIKEALDYDEKEDDSDNDTIDALGIALMQMISRGTEAINEEELMAGNPYELSGWTENSNGILIPDNPGSEEDVSDVKDPFIRFVITGRWN